MTTTTSKFENVAAKPIAHVAPTSANTTKLAEKTFTELLGSNRHETEMPMLPKPTGNYPQVTTLTDTPIGQVQLIAQQASSNMGGQIQKENNPTGRPGVASGQQKTETGVGTSLLTAVKGFGNSQQSGEDLDDLWHRQGHEYESEMSPAEVVQTKRQQSILAALFPGLYGDNDPFTPDKIGHKDKQVKQWQQNRNVEPLVPRFVDEIVAKEEQNKIKNIVNTALLNNCATRRNVFQTMACAKLYPKMKTLEPDWDVVFFNQMMPAGYDIQYGPDEEYGKFGPIEVNPGFLAENEEAFSTVEAV